MSDVQDRLAGRTALYRLFDASGALLYVGITGNLDVRWGQHAIEKSWWHEVAERKVAWFDTRPEAAGKETRAIQDEQPRYNILGTPKHRELSGAIRGIDLYSIPWLSDVIAALEAIEDPAERAKALGDTLDAVPRFQRWLRLARQQAVVEMNAAGMSYRAIGKQLGISAARVQQIVAGRVTGKRAADEKAERPAPDEGRASDA